MKKWMQIFLGLESGWEGRCCKLEQSNWISLLGCYPGKEFQIQLWLEVDIHWFCGIQVPSKNLKDVYVYHTIKVLIIMLTANHLILIEIPREGVSHAWLDAVFGGLAVQGRGRAWALELRALIAMQQSSVGNIRQLWSVASSYLIT